MKTIPAPKFDIADAMAVKAVCNGTATEEQQKRAMQWLLDGVCTIRELSYDPASDRNTSFAEGRRFVGLEVAMYWQRSADSLKQLSAKRKGKRPTPT